MSARHVCVHVFAEGNVKLYLRLSDSSSDSALAGYDGSSRHTGTFRCRVHGCASVFRRACQLASHYTEFHPCDVSPPRNQQDLELYNRFFSSYQPAPSRKRKRSPSASQRSGSKKKTPRRTSTKSG